MPRPGPGEIERRLRDLMEDLDKIARPDVPGHEIRTFYTSIQDITAFVLATSGVCDAEKAVRARVAELRDAISKARHGPEPENNPKVLSALQSARAAILKLAEEVRWAGGNRRSEPL
jgi:hypothetical protein